MISYPATNIVFFQDDHARPKCWKFWGVMDLSKPDSVSDSILDRISNLGTNKMDSFLTAHGGYTFLLFFSCY